MAYAMHIACAGLNIDLCHPFVCRQVHSLLVLILKHEQFARNQHGKMLCELHSLECYCAVKKKKKIPHRPKSIARELIPCRHFEPARVKPN